MTATSGGGRPDRGPRTADREIVISRAIGAPRQLVFEAFTEVRHLSRHRSRRRSRPGPGRRRRGRAGREHHEWNHHVRKHIQGSAGRGGADTDQQYLDAGLVDEFSITLAPVLFGTGIRLFDHLDPDRITLAQTRTDASSRVTHLTCTVAER